MKIVMICEFYNETLEYQENLLTKYYVKHGHQVTVITSTFESVFDYYSDKHDASAPTRSYLHQGAKIIKLPYRYNFLNRVRAYTRIDNLLEAEAPDLIYVHSVMPNFPEAIAYMKKHTDCRMIMDYHGDYSNSGKNWFSLRILHGLIRKRFLDQARPYLSKIFPIVPASAQFLHEIYAVPESEMEVLPLGADTDLIEEVRAEGDSGLRQKLGINKQDFVIFSGGKLAPAKRTELLIDALELLPSLNVHLVIVGQAAEEDQRYYQMLIDKSKGKSNIHFVGWLNRLDIYRHLQIADLAVFPASQSILWQSAIAMGLPLIAGDVGHQDISYLNLQENIVVLQKADILAPVIAKNIQDIVTNPERLKRMHHGALKVADEHLNWNKLIYKTLRFNQQEDFFDTH